MSQASLCVPSFRHFCKSTIEDLSDEKQDFRRDRRHLGGLILLNGLMSNSSGSASGAYNSGQTGGLVFGGLLLVVGVYYFFKKPKPKA